MKTYDIINHTADIGIKVYGENIDKLFLNAGHAMFKIMVETTGKKPASQKAEHKKFLLYKQGNSLEDIFVAWLSELLYLFSVEGLMLEKADILRLDSDCIQAEVSGRIFNPDFHRIKTEIKAVTYHELKISQTPKGYEGQVIFDV